MANIITVGALGNDLTLSNGDIANTTLATAFVGGNVNVVDGATLNVGQVLGAGVATTFNVSDGGTINFSPTLQVSAGNEFNIGTGGTLSLGDTVDLGALGSINFDGAGGTLSIPESVLSTEGNLTTIQGFGANDSLIISNPQGNITSATYADNTLTFHDADGNDVSSLNLTLDPDVDADNFSLAPGANGTLTVTATACYLRGTRVTTERGEVAIEDIRIGDRIATVSGAFRPVKWVGRRGYSSTFAAKNPDVQPILFARGSIADGVPSRDLYVSPQHAMFLDGVLIDAELLVNGTSIRRIATDEPVEYFNLEFDTHDVILAEGAASESFLNRECRAMFQNAAEYDALYPNEAPGEPVFYARRVADGFTLEAVRERLNARAGGAAEAAASVGRLEGAIDRADWTRVSGWAHDRGSPDRPVALEILVDNEVVARVMANRHRRDLEAAGFGDGRCGFDVALPRALSPREHHSIEVRRAADAQPLRGAPLLIEAVPGLEASAGALQETLLGLGAADADQLDRMLRFVMDSMDEVVQAKARTEGQGHARVTRFQARGEALAPGAAACIRAA